MAQTGYTPISIYYSATATNTPTAGNLVAGELAINTADGKLFYKDSSGVVQTLATKSATSGTFTTVTTSTLTSPAATALTIQSAGTTAITVDTSQNVGIGTTSPSYKLHTVGTGGTATAVSDNTVTSSYAGFLAFSQSSSGYFIQGNANYVSYGGANSLNIINTAAGPITFFNSAGTERMRIDSSGILLVGTTTSPSGSNNLKIANTSSSAQFNTFAGTMIVANATPTTLFNVVNNGLYIVNAYISVADATNYDAYAIILSANGDSRIATQSNGTLVLITLSGGAVRVTQSAGSSQTITYAYHRLA